MFNKCCIRNNIQVNILFTLTEKVHDQLKPFIFETTKDVNKNTVLTFLIKKKRDHCPIMQFESGDMNFRGLLIFLFIFFPGFH